MTVVTVAIPSQSWLADHYDWVMWHGLTGSISSWSLRRYVDIMSYEWLVSIKVTLDRWGKTFTHFHHLTHHFTFLAFVEVSKTRKTTTWTTSASFPLFLWIIKRNQAMILQVKEQSVKKQTIIYYFLGSVSSSINGCQICLSFLWLTVSSVILPARLHWGNPMTILFWCCITHRATGPRFWFWWL